MWILYSSVACKLRFVSVQWFSLFWSLAYIFMNASQRSACHGIVLSLCFSSYATDFFFFFLHKMSSIKWYIL